VSDVCTTGGSVPDTLPPLEPQVVGIFLSDAHVGARDEQADARGSTQTTFETSRESSEVKLLLLLHQLGRVDWACPGATALLQRHLKEWDEFMNNAASASKLVNALDAVTNHLQCEQQKALHTIERASAAAQQSIEQRKDEVLKLAQENATAITAYAGLTAPTSYEQLCERNRLRHDLQRAAQAVQGVLRDVFETINMPSEQLHSVQAPMLQQLSDSIVHIQRLKDATAGLFDRCGQQVMCDQKAAKQTLAELWPHIEPVNNFVHQLNMESTSEIEEGQAIHRKRLHELQQEEVRYVRANESPRKNADFASVREQLAKEQATLEELGHWTRDRMEAHKSWEALIGSMPCGDAVNVLATPDSKGRKRKRLWFW